MQYFPISPLFAPRRPGRKSRVHTLYYIDHSANSVCLSPRESPVVYVWSTGAARGVSSRNPSHWLRSCTL
jgi:hypothetical protein